MDGLINIAILEQLEHEIQRDENNLQRRILRDNSNPFDVPEETFLKYYRLTKEITRSVIEMLRPHLNVPQRQSCVPVELKVLTLLYFLGHGSYQKCVGINVNLSLEQSTVSRIIAETTDCIVDHLMPLFVKFPVTIEEQNTIKQQFYEKFNFPGIIGAVDCTHIGILAPSTDDPVRPGIVYYNRKGFYSLNVQMICDSNLIITNCNARFPGSVHDSAIWSLSTARQVLERQYTNGQHNSSWLIGDSGYPLEPWLLTPIENVAVDVPEGRYSQAHIRSRNTIERCFGCLKQRFRCLLKHRILHYTPVRAAKIIYSCVVLHNICFQRRVPQPIEDIAEIEFVDQILFQNENNLPNNGRNHWHQEGRRIRSQIVNTHFA